jgi:hypothetical protein
LRGILDERQALTCTAVNPHCFGSQVDIDTAGTALAYCASAGEFGADAGCSSNRLGVVEQEAEINPSQNQRYQNRRHERQLYCNTADGVKRYFSSKPAL